MRKIAKNWGQTTFDFHQLQIPGTVYRIIHMHLRNENPLTAGDEWLKA